MHRPFCTQICPDMGSAYFIVNVLVVSCCSWLSKAPQNHSYVCPVTVRDCSFINTFGSFNQWHSLRRPYALMEFWASATLRCAGWHRDCTPTYTARITIPKTRKPFFAAAAVGLCGARVSFSPRVRSEDSVVAGNGARRIRFGPLSLLCVGAARYYGELTAWWRWRVGTTISDYVRGCPLPLSVALENLLKPSQINQSHVY